MYTSGNVAMTPSAGIFTGSNKLETKAPEVHAEVDRVLMLAKALNGSISNLEERLSSVLAQHAVEGRTNAVSPEPIRVPLAQTIHSAVVDLELLRERIASIMDRLEV